MKLKSCILASMLMFSSTFALAHGDAAWIMNDPKLSYCCGVNDCERAPKGAVVWSKEGWVIVATGQVFPEFGPDTHMSIDRDFWYCSPAYMAPKKKCLMVPSSGV